MHKYQEVYISLETYNRNLFLGQYLHLSASTCQIYSDGYRTCNVFMQFLEIHNKNINLNNKISVGHVINHFQQPQLSQLCAYINQCKLSRGDTRTTYSWDTMKVK